MKDQSFPAMKGALRYAQAVSFEIVVTLLLTLVLLPQAFRIHPNDKAVLYNIAMIQQKSAELLFSVHVAKRTLKDLQKVIDSATHAQKWACLDYTL